MPSTVTNFLKHKWPFISATLGLIALVAISVPSFDSAPAAKSERETTLSSMSKAGLSFFVTPSPTSVQTSTTPVTLTATIESGQPIDNVTVTWNLPEGVTLATGSLTDLINHVEINQPTTSSISVLIAPGTTNPILVNAHYARGDIATGNGATIAVNQVNQANQSVPAVKRVKFESTGDQRIFE